MPIRRIGRARFPDFSVGQGSIRGDRGGFRVGSMPGIPSLVSFPGRREKAVLPAPSDRRDVVPVFSGVPMVLEQKMKAQAGTLFQTDNVRQTANGRWCVGNICGLTVSGRDQLLKEQGRAAFPPTIPAVKKTPGILDTINSIIQKKPMALDLGSLLGDLGTAYIGARYGGTTNVGNPTIIPREAFQPNFMQTAELGGIPGIEVIPEAGYTPGACWNPKAKCGAGGWVKRRRRRKRLATASDIKDLVSLKSVFGKGEGLKTWIATH